MLFLTPMVLHDGTTIMTAIKCKFSIISLEHNGQSKGYSNINVKAQVLNEGVEEKTISFVTGQKKLQVRHRKKLAKIAEERRTILQQSALFRRAVSCTTCEFDYLSKKVKGDAKE